MSVAVVAASALARWRRDPVAFAVECLGVDLDAWQRDALAATGGPPSSRRRLCMRACTGPGKSLVLAILGWHRLACFAGPGEHPKGAALSITRDNLRDNLWPEMAKWRSRSPVLNEAFEWTGERIYSKDHPETWFLAARSFAADADQEAIGRALSGLHSQFPFVLLDETGDMPVAVGRAAEQIFTGSPVDALIAQAGNPTSVEGLLYESCTRGGWSVVTITADPDDPKRTPRVSVDHAREMIAAHGRDNPWVAATILGVFPSTGFNSLFGPEELDAAMARVYRPEEIAQSPVILGGDVAREGDDSSAIARRQGRTAFPIRTMRIPDTMRIAEQFGQEFRTHEADALFIDGTGGYGAGVIDDMRRTGFDVIGVHFGSKPSDPQYFNKRSEMYFEMSRWVKAGGALPLDKALADELRAHTYVFTRDTFRIVEKDLVKAKLGRSPDRADALALTFAYPVVKKAFPGRPARRDYDPYAPERTAPIAARERATVWP